MNRLWITALTFVATLTLSGQPLRLEKTIPLSAAADGRIGQLAFDVKQQRLFVPVVATGSVEIVDVKAGKLQKTLTGFKSPVSTAFDPVSNRLFVASREDGTVTIVDGNTYSILNRVIWPGSPEMVRMEPAAKQVFVSFGTNVGFMDVNGRQLGTIRLDAPGDAFHASSSGSQVWVNVPTRRYVAAADRHSRTVRQMWSVSVTGSGGPNYGIAADERNRRLFVTCRRPSTLVTLSLDTGYRIDTRATVNNADEVHYDPVARRLYVPGVDGQIDVVQQTTKDRYEPLGRVESAPGARTAVLAAELGRFFVAVPKRGAQQAEIRIFAVSK